MVLGVIPARWGSTRFPGKPLCQIAGKPMIRWVWERARLCRHLERLVVATDDRRIRQACDQFGAETMMTSPDHPSGTDRVAEVAMKFPGADIVVNIQGDEPLLDPAVVDAVIGKLMETPDLDMTTPAAPAGKDIAAQPDIVKVVTDREGRALYFSRAPIPYRRDSSAEAAPEFPFYRRHIGLYAYRRDFLLRLVTAGPCLLESVEKLEQLRALFVGGRVGVVDVDWTGMAVDRPEDVRLVEKELRLSGLA